MASNEQDKLAQNPPRLTLEQRIARIAELNDQCRKCRGNHILNITQGIQQLGADAVLHIIKQVRDFEAFTPDNDPHGEHDFGSLKHDGSTIFWKFDYYDKHMEFGSEDPADEACTVRVLTVMLASEY